MSFCFLFLKKFVKEVKVGLCDRMCIIEPSIELCNSSIVNVALRSVIVDLLERFNLYLKNFYSSVIKKLPCSGETRSFT